MARCGVDKENTMSEAFVPLDLRSHWNAGTKNVQTPAGYLWPAPANDPDRTLLNDLPEGDALFWGIPFHLANRKAPQNAPAFIAVGKEAGNEVPASVAIPVGQTARRVLFAHVCAPTGAALVPRPETAYALPGFRGLRWGQVTLEGAGEVIGQYRIVLTDGTIVEQSLRRRFEIHDLVIPWGHHPFLCRHCREFLPVPSDDHSMAWGRAQWGVRKESDELKGWWLFDWENPFPEKVIDRIEVVALGTAAMALGAITLCHEASDPFAWPPREDIAVAVEGEAASDSRVEAEMTRGVIVRQDRLFRPTEQFLSTDETGWGQGGQEVTAEGYLEVHGSPAGALRIKAGNHTKDFRWGDVLEQKAIQQGPIRVEVLAPQGKQWVHVRVEDAETGKPVESRIHFRSPQGAYFAPHGHQSDVNTAWFEDIGGDCKIRGIPYAYIDGTCQIELPVGSVLVEAVRGFEYTPVRQHVEIRRGQRDVTLHIKRAFDMKQRGFYSGDTHVHFLSSQSCHLEAAGEDVNVVHLLASQWGRLFTSWEEFTGGLAPTSSDEHKIWVSQENRQHVLGHISLLGLKEMIAPMCSGGAQEDWVGGAVEALMAEWAEACRKQGGLVVIPHMPMPDCENTANIVMGQADAAEMCWIWLGQEIGPAERSYYQWLNAGQKLPIVGGTDKMSNGRVLGGSRTYAWLREDEPFTFENWCHAVRRGTTFASTGAMIDLRVEGRQMGEEIRLPGNGGTVEVIATAESTWPLTAVELIVNGRSVARQDANGNRRMVTITFDLKAERSCWVAARCWGPYYTDAGPVMAHSSPIYIDVGGVCAFEPTDGQYLLTHMEGGVSWAERIGVFRDGGVRARLIKLFREAQEELKRRAKTHGVSLGD
jgi:hypothetical protein